MKKVRQKWLTVFMILLAVLFIPGIADAKTKEYQGNLWNFKKTIKETSGAFTYYAYPSKNQKEAWIYKIDMKGGKNCSKLSIPSKLDDKRVTRLGSREVREVGGVYNIFDCSHEPWHEYDFTKWGKSKYDRIKKLVIPNTVKVIQRGSFCDMNSITTVKIPKSVKTIGEYTFYHCDKLKKVELPAGLKSMDMSVFWRCWKLKEIKVPKNSKYFQRKGKFLITKNKKELVYAPPEKTLQIPEGVRSLNAFAFINCVSSTVHIPASVKVIDKNAFTRTYYYEIGIPVIKDITVDNKNSSYAKSGQCIYDKRDNSLFIIIRDKTETLYIPEGVERLSQDIVTVGGEPPVFSEAGDVLSEDEGWSRIVFPKTLKTVVDNRLDQLFAEQIYFMGTTPPQMLLKEKKTVRINYSHANVYVPEGSEEAYRQWYKTYMNKDWTKGLNTFKNSYSKI